MSHNVSHKAGVNVLLELFKKLLGFGLAQMRGYDPDEEEEEEPQPRFFSFL